MERLLDENTAKQVKEVLNEMEGTVKCLLFKGDNEYSQVTEQLLKEVSEVNDKIIIESYDINDSLSEEFDIDKELTPAMVMLNSNGEDLGVRFYGIPSGHEFSTLLQELIAMSKGGKTEFSEEAVNKLSSIDKKLRIRAFITPTCPYCPKAVIAAQQTAMINKNILGEMVEANEFGPLSMKHGVSSVPHTIIEAFENGEWVVKNEFVGAYPEPNFVEEILKAVE